MTFVKRRIDAQIALDGDTFDGSNNTIMLTDLRCDATVLSYNGSAGTFASTLQMRISGMKNKDMAKLSTLGFTVGLYNKNLINVYAGDDINGMSLVFNGGITYGNVDYNGMPNVGVDIVASALANLQYSSIAPSSYAGNMSVASMLQAICAAANPPLAFVNNGVLAVLRNHAVGGTATDQIRDICVAAGINYAYKGTNPQTLYVWPAGGSIDATVINLNAQTGLVGYPQYSVRGCNVSAVFNPNAFVGRQVNLQSSTPGPAANAPQQSVSGGNIVSGVNGTFSVLSVTHNLVTQTPKGAWFTHMELGSNPYNAR